GTRCAATSMSTHVPHIGGSSMRDRRDSVFDRTREFDRPREQDAAGYGGPGARVVEDSYGGDIGGGEYGGREQWQQGQGLGGRRQYPQYGNDFGQRDMRWQPRGS